MTRFMELIEENDFLVIVSLPKNDVELAIAACESGADAIKVHLNVEHKASGTVFGSWAEERDMIEQIIKAVNCPVGLMPGAAVTATEDELYEASRAGIDFIDIYDYDMPVWMLSSKLAKMVAVGADYTLADVQSLETIGADMIEASVVPAASYRLPLTVRDLEAYRSIVTISELPVFVPSQKRIEPDDLIPLREAGLQGVILGTISIGDTPESFRERLPLFIDANS